MPVDLDTPYELITTPDGLAAACGRLRLAGCFAFDTEFVGEENYERQVGLIQAATKEFVALIDPMGGLDAAPFWALVHDPGICKVLHSGSEDIAICWAQTGRGPANVFDTQIAAGLCGFGYPISLARLIHAVLQTTLHKTQTLTDWRRRPLSESQLAYAAEDVVHLPALHVHLSRRLDKLGRTAWLADECERAAASPGRADNEQKLRRLRGTGSLSAGALAIADALMTEREKLAAELDRPPRVVLRDHLLIELARRGWTDVTRMRTLRGINLSTPALKRLATAVETAKALPRDQWPTPIAHEEENPLIEVVVDLLTAALRDHCNRNELALSLLASKQDVRRWARSQVQPDPLIPASLLGSGWRREAVGALLEDLLQGRNALRLNIDGGIPNLELQAQVDLRRAAADDPLRSPSNINDAM